MKIAILGFGREGRAVLEFIKKSPKYDFAEIWILDQSSKLKINSALKKRASFPVKSKTGKNYLKTLNKFDLVFRSPGIPYNLPEIQQAIKNNVIFSSATKLFFENCSSRIIGITGTKGKGTTSTLLYEILKNSGFDVYLAGNIGKPALEILPQLKQHSIVVLELSSFQLQDSTISPSIAVVLNIFPDHLDTHLNFKEYLDAKTNIAKYQTGNNKLFYFKHNKYAAVIAKKGSAKKIPIFPEKFSLFKADQLKILGEHNWQNAVMAASVTKELGSPTDKIIKTVVNFTGLEHRLEFVYYWNGINFYNDSASTNPQTTMAAILSFREPLILIAGGKDKGLNYKSLAQVIKKTSTKLIILFGENKHKIKKTLLPHLPKTGKRKIDVLLCENLKEAFKKSVENAQSKDVIVFSPGAASFDIFKDYADRGRQFKELVNKLG